METKIKNLEDIISRYNWANGNQISFNETLKQIRSKVNNKKLYLGIIGEFSSGKSTLINSLVGANFLTIGAWQGTTTIPTFFEYASSKGLKIEMNDKKTYTYKKNKKQLKKLFPGSHENPIEKLTFWRRFQDWFNRLFNIGDNKSDFNNLIDTITTSDALSEEIQRVTIYYPSPILKNGIVIIDTPGLDSLNPKHTILTKNVISNICDSALIVIPSEKPVSEHIIEFINNNLAHSIKRCLFFLTKVELLKPKDIELLRANVAKRLSNGLGLSGISPICAPTLLHLESIKAVEESGLKIRLSEDDKKSLLDNYAKNTQLSFEQLSINREEIITERLLTLMSVLQAQLSTELEKTRNQLNKEKDELAKLRKIKLSEFIYNYRQSNDIAKEYEYSKTIVGNICERMNKSMVLFVHDYCYSVSSKKEIGDCFQTTSFSNKWQNTHDECVKSCNTQIWDLLMKYQGFIDNFKYKFKEHYLIDGLNFAFEINKQEIDKLLRNSNITTPSYVQRNAFVRFFTSKETIRLEVIEHSRSMMGSYFNKLNMVLGKMIDKANKQLDENLTKAFDSFKKRFDDYIRKRIEEEKSKENYLEKTLVQINSDLASLR